MAVCSWCLSWLFYSECAAQNHGGSNVKGQFEQLP